MGKAKAARSAFKSLRKAKLQRKKKGFAGKNAVVGGALGGTLGAAISEMVNNDEPMHLPAVVSEAAQAVVESPTPKDEDAQFSAARVLEGTLIRRQDIIPELGPHEGQYAQHLNLIIERVAKLESEVSTQSNLLNRVAAIVDAQTDYQKARDTRENRRRDEEQVEKQNRVGEILDAGMGMAKAYAAATAVGLTGLATAGAAFAGAEIVGDLTEDSTTEMDSVFDTLEFIEETGVKATMGAAALKGTGVAQSATNFVKSKVPLTAAAPAAAKAVPAQIPNAAKYQKYLGNMKAAQEVITKLSKKASEYTKAVKEFIKTLPARFAKFIGFLGRNLVKWLLIIEAIAFMIRSTELLLLGSITESEWHSGNKEQINKILSLFGAPWVLAKIGFLVGTAIPVLGNVAGGIAGLLVGIIWGDKIYSAIGMDKLASALYDFIVLGKTDSMKGCWNGLTNWLTNEVPKMMAEAAKTIAVQATGVDIASSEEELSTKFGEDTSTVDILRRASEGFGTDEDAILGALNRVKTKEDWKELQQDFQVMREVEGIDQTLDEYLKDELGSNEYETAMDLIDKNLGLPPKIRIMTRKDGFLRLTKEQILKGVEEKQIIRRTANIALKKLDARIEEQAAMAEIPVPQNDIRQDERVFYGMEIPDGQVTSSPQISYSEAADKGNEIIVVKAPSRRGMEIPMQSQTLKVPLNARPSVSARDSFPLGEGPAYRG